MRRFRTTAASLVMAAGITAASAGLAGAAVAAPAQHASAASYKTWHAAQKAAGFRLLKPTQTYSLALSGGVAVATCTGRNVRKGTKQVVATYVSAKSKTLSLLGFVQDNARRLCRAAPKVKVLAKVRVDGVIGVLGRSCQGPKAHPCAVVFLVLTWTKRGHSFGVVAFHQSRTHVVGFARHLVRVP